MITFRRRLLARPQRKPLPDPELRAGLEREALADHNAQLARDLYGGTRFARKLRSVQGGRT